MAAETVKLDIKWDGRREGMWDELQVERAQLLKWAAGVCGNQSIGEMHWCPTTFTKSQYHEFRDRLVTRGLVRQRARHYSSGFEVTSKGAAICRGLVDKYGDGTTDLPTPGLRLSK